MRKMISVFVVGLVFSAEIFGQGGVFVANAVNVIKWPGELKDAERGERGVAVVVLPEYGGDMYVRVRGEKRLAEVEKVGEGHWVITAGAKRRLYVEEEVIEEKDDWRGGEVVKRGDTIFLRVGGKVEVHFLGVERRVIP